MVILFSAPSAAVTISPSDTSVEVGDTFTVTVDFESGDQIGAIKLQLSGDPALVERTNQAAGSLLVALPSTDFLVLSQTPTTAGFGATTLFLADQFGPGELLIITFRALAVGTANFSIGGEFTNSVLLDPVGFSSTTSVEITGTTVPPIPLPASGVLLLAALGGLYRLRGRRS